MFTKTILAASALLSIVNAVPMQHHHKRDYTYETSTILDVTTVDVTTTVWLQAGETPPAHYGNKGHHAKADSQLTSALTVPAASYASPSSPAESSPESTWTPTPSTPAAPTTSAYVAPTSQAPAPAPEPTTAVSGGSGGAPSGSFSGQEITYYTPGMGSCGITNSESDSIVALAAGAMQAAMTASGDLNPNHNPLCGKSITISYGGKTAQATIEDTCPGCSDHWLDLTPSLFQEFADLSVGRVSGVEWWFN